MRILIPCFLILLGCSGLWTPENEPEEGSFDGDATAQFIDCNDTIVSAPVWQGEYPSPVVFLSEPTELNGFGHPCLALQAQPSRCMVPADLYHPWGGNGRGFTTLRGKDRFEVLRPIDVDGLALAPGDEVIVRAYYGEGFCGMESSGHSFSEMCPEFWTDDSGELFRAISTSDVERQFFLAPCENGSPSWIEVNDDLFSTQNVEEGDIVGYGEVAPPGSGQHAF